MSTYLAPTLCLSDKPISSRALAYYEQATQDDLHDLVLDQFVTLEGSGEIDRATLGRRIRRQRAQITRWLSSPTNLTLKTVSHLLLGMGLKLTFGVERVASVAEQPTDLPAEQAVAPETSVTHETLS